MRASLPWLCLAVCLAVASCTCEKPKTEAGTGPSSAGSEPPSATSEGPNQSVAPEAPPKLLAKDLQPSISAVGEAGVIPTKLVVRLARDAFSDKQLGAAKPGTELELRPPVEGSLAITGRAELTFTPKGGLDPNTQYSVHLKSVDSTDGALTDPGDGSWADSFATP